MTSLDRFTLLPVQKQTVLQPDSPVYIHCSRRSMERRTGAAFVQVRMVNRSERMICNVFLRIEGLNQFEEPCFVMPEVILAGCNAAPHTVFGEERLISIDRIAVCQIRITVERVTFADGMIWRRLPGQKILDTAQWKKCTCAMPNPPKASKCRLCGRQLHVPAVTKEPDLFPLSVEPEALPVPPPQPLHRPQPIVREPGPVLPEAVLPEVPEKKSRSGALLAILIILSILAFLSVVGLMFYALYLGLIPYEDLYFFKKFFQNGLQFIPVML